MRHFADRRTFDELRQGDPFQKSEDLAAKIGPQLVSQTPPASLAILVAAAAGGVQPLVHGADDVGDGDLVRERDSR